MEQLATNEINVIITGATGMVGEGVLHECLHHPSVKNILLLSRKPSGIVNPQVTEIIHQDFLNIQPIKDKLTNYNACFFCLGVSSIGMKEELFTKLTFQLTTHVAGVLSEVNKGMTFCYVSGAGTDNTEKGKRMWARVKGRTENALLHLPFKNVFNFRPGVIKATKGLKNTLSLYKYFKWLIPIIELTAPGYITSLKEIGLAMINATIFGYEKHIIEVPDIKKLAALTENKDRK
jgi:hypothetical protein